MNPLELKHIDAATVGKSTSDADLIASKANMAPATLVLSSPGSTNIFVPGYLGIMVTRQQQFCCIFAATKDKFDSFSKKLFHSSTSHTYHHNSSLFLNRHKNIHALRAYCSNIGYRRNTDNSLPVLLSSWNYGDKYAKY